MNFFFNTANKKEKKTQFIHCVQRSEAILKAWEDEMPHWKDKWVLSFNLSPFGSVSKNNMLKCCVKSISSLSSGHIIIVKIRKMNWEIIVSMSVLINILPPEPSSSSWGCDDSPSSPSPQRNPQIFVSAPAAYCTASPCWDIRSGNRVSWNIFIGNSEYTSRCYCEYSYCSKRGK